VSNILIPVDRDPIKRGKDCQDWCPLQDGTKSGDPVYCDFSLKCRQTDENRKGFVSNWYKFRDIDTNEQNFDYFCTGIYPENFKNLDSNDEEVS